jgi:UDP-galactopyranose mutase
VNEPYYLVPNETSAALMQAYLRDAQEVQVKVLFAGRLGHYAYYYMDQGHSLFSKSKSSRLLPVTGIDSVVTTSTHHFVARLDELIGPQCPATLLPSDLLLSRRRHARL